MTLHLSEPAGADQMSRVSSADSFFGQCLLIAACFTSVLQQVFPLCKSVCQARCQIEYRLAGQIQQEVQKGYTPDCSFYAGLLWGWCLLTLSGRVTAQPASSQIFLQLASPTRILRTFWGRSISSLSTSMSLQGSQVGHKTCHSKQNPQSRLTAELCLYNPGT